MRARRLALARAVAQALLLTQWRVSSAQCQGASLRLLVINVTKWGPQAAGYFNQLDSDIGFVAEHHLAPKRTKQLFKEVGRASYSAAVSGAVPGVGGGTSAGVAVIWRKRLSCEPVWLDSFPERSGQLALAKLNMKGGSQLLLGTAYLWTGQANGACNQQLLASIATAVASTGLPWLLFGDWQMSPQQMQSTGWPSAQGCHILAQLAELTGTCWQGAESTYIDYFVASCWAAPPRARQRSISGMSMRHSCSHPSRF